jgi:alpha-glucosidase
MMLLTMRGTPTLYYGDELGMENVEVPEDKIKDPFEKLDPGKGQGRDPQRTPMQWNAQEENAGFTTGEPWLPLADNWRDVNVETQKDDSDSMLMLTKRLINLRREHPAFSIGEHRLVLTDVKGPVVAYRREHENGNFLVALNLSSEAASFELPYGYKHMQAELSTVPGTAPAKFHDRVDLLPDEGVILRNDS